MEKNFEIILAPIPSFAMLSLAMQSLSPQSNALAGIPAQWRGIDAASPASYPSPYLLALPASLDGKMQLPAGSLSPIA